MLSDATIRASWIGEKAAIRQWLIEQKRFNPKSVDKFIETFIESMVFAKILCTSDGGMKAAFRQFATERPPRPGL